MSGDSAIMAFDAATGGWSGSGVVIGVARRLAHMLRLRHADSDEGLALFNLHLEVASTDTVKAKRRLLDSVWRHTSESAGRARVMLGDMSFARRDDCRVDLRRIEVVPAPDAVARHVEGRTDGYTEFEQMGYTRRQRSDGVAVLLSSIDHVYARIPPSDLDGSSVMTLTIGHRRPLRCPQPARPHSGVGAGLPEALPPWSSSGPPLRSGLPFRGVPVPRRWRPLPSALQAERYSGAPRGRVAAQTVTCRILPSSVSASLVAQVVRASRRGDRRAVRRAALNNPRSKEFLDTRGAKVIAKAGFLDYIEEDARRLATPAEAEGQKKQEHPSSRALLEVEEVEEAIGRLVAGWSSCRDSGGRRPHAQPA